MTDLRELYQQVILDHNRAPRNFRTIEGADRVSVGHNPVCGDRLSLFVTLDGDRIADVAFQGSGCAISTASASLMTESVRGKSVGEAEAIFGKFHDLLTGPPDVKADPAVARSLGKLAVFSGVREFPIRVKCATLSWHTLHAALHRQEATTTE